ncbi:cell wall metabolism sensor histidine kinase WalK [uncultured Treponema sp.]|uniref:sensor histidine kinase n=1 Tax=uncultured Treponema sp. TaxID=162155 RepID=UPI0015BF23D4|nr:HAMP domain-containing sensor histidine kinase [uncultured Treponema sp.]
MKIKRQLRIFLLLVVLIPLVAFATIPINRRLAAQGVSFEKLICISLLVASVIELACIMFTIHISSTISKSITFLQRSTKRIADGELARPLERRKSHRGENEITDLIVNLDKMRLTLLENDERRKRFIMGMSHDLRTPVAVIKGYLEAIDDGVVSGEKEISKSVNIILNKTRQLEAMLNSLINFVKLETTEQKNNLHLQPLLPIVQEFAESSINTGKIFNRNVQAEISLSPDTKVMLNRELVLRALDNLYSNAQRYTKDKGVITIKAEETETEAKISVEDSGIGINDKDIQFIFDIFYRASNSRTEPGHGIGLSVVKNIMDSHGWKIDVKSQVGVGSNFTITIPKRDLKA